LRERIVRKRNARSIRVFGIEEARRIDALSGRAIRRHTNGAGEMHLPSPLSAPVLNRSVGGEFGILNASKQCVGSRHSVAAANLSQVMLFDARAEKNKRGQKKAPEKSGAVSLGGN
jgi:hypothetical protein